MTIGSGHHAILNNGYFFRTPMGSMVMLSFFANRGQREKFDRMNFYGQINVTAEDPPNSTNRKYTTTIDFFRAWFGVNTPRTISYGSLELSWTAPDLRTEENELEGVAAGEPVDTFITVSRHDAPSVAQAQQGIVGEIYGLFGTNNLKPPKLDGMWILEEVPAAEDNSGQQTPMTLILSYADLDLKAVDPQQLSVVRWNGGAWCKVAESPGSRDEVNRIKVQVIQLNTWYALGSGFPECP